MDPYSTLQVFDEKLAAAGSNAVKRNLIGLRDHLIAEMTTNTEAGIAGFTPDAKVVTNIAGGQVFEMGIDAIAGGYSASAADPNATMWVEWDHIAVDDKGFGGHGTIHTIMNGAAAAAQQLAIDDPDALYDVSSKLVVFGAMTDGILSREELFMDPTTRTATLAVDPPTSEGFRARFADLVSST